MIKVENFYQKSSQDRQRIIACRWPSNFVADNDGI